MMHFGVIPLCAKPFVTDAHVGDFVLHDRVVRQGDTHDVAVDGQYFGCVNGVRSMAGDAGLGSHGLVYFNEGSV